VSLSPDRPNEANYENKYPILVGNLSFLHTFSPNTIFEIRAAGYKMTQDYTPSSGDRDTPGHIDALTGAYSINNDFWARWESERASLTSSFSHNISNFIKGSHDLKIGIEIERARGGGTHHLTGTGPGGVGGITYYDYDGQPDQAVSYTYRQWGVNWRYTLYAQDDWKVTDSLVVNPGIRYSMMRAIVPDLSQDSVYSPKNFEPRLGFAWDISKDHKTVVKAHYGRYFEGSKTYFFGELTPMTDTIWYSVGPNWSTLTELFRISGASLFSMDPNTKHPSMDQVVAGVERVLGKDLSGHVLLVYRKWNNFIEAVNTTALFEKVPYTDPETGEVFTIYNQLNPGEDHFYLTNPKVGKDIGAAYPEMVRVDPTREYRAIEFGINKRFSNNWQASIFYVYSKAEGTYSNAHGSHQRFGMAQSNVYRDPNYQINLQGRPVISTPHLLKVYATYVFPLDFSLSASYMYSSGTTWERNIRITSVNQAAPYIKAEPTGSRRYRATNNLDLRVEKSFRYRNFRFSAMFDMFNVFNRGNATAIRDYGANFGKNTGVIAPRSYQAGVRLFF
jgi:hypothetical protein